MLLAAAIAVLAGVLIFLFVDSRSENGGLIGGGSTRVLVAKKLIPKGSSGEVIAAQQLTATQTLDASDVKTGAITDPKALAGQSAVADVFPGQQLTASDFSAAAGASTRLGPDQRGVQVAVDATHGLIGNIQTGDRVDVFYSGTGAGEAVVKPLINNALVLAAPVAAGGEGGGTSVLLRTSTDDAAKVAFTGDNARVYLVLRPPVGAKNVPDSRTTLDSVLNASAETQPAGAGD